MMVDTTETCSVSVFNILTDNTEAVNYLLDQHIACVRLNCYIIS
jgi:hypothetical protein